MPNEFLDTLKGFTPDGSGLDRDALLFEAGRASAGSPARAWGVVALLALSQALTLGLCLLRSPERPAVPGEPPPPSLSPAQQDGPPSMRGMPDEEVPVPASTLLPDDPPLRASDRTLFISLE
jgi:hypothetical protein